VIDKLDTEERAKRDRKKAEQEAERELAEAKISEIPAANAEAGL
jgi:hypothetical protein